MSDLDTHTLTAADLPITLYLNQRLTFDALAAFEDGFSQLSTVQTSSSGKTSTEIGGEAQLGVHNVFAFLGVKLGGKGSRQAERTQMENTTDEIVHTPASLFAKLRKELIECSLVRFPTDRQDLAVVHPGEFVEFEARLRKNPVVELLSSYSQLIPVIELFTEQPEEQTQQPAPARRGKGNRGTAATQQRARKSGESQLQIIRKQIDAVLSVLTATQSEDVIAEAGDMRVLLTTDKNYFIDPTMNDLIDGTFRVFGKATRIIPEGSDEKISLLRKSPAGQFGSIVDGFAAMMEHSAEDVDLNFQGSSETEIRGPAMQVIPISIFS